MGYIIFNISVHFSLCMLLFVFFFARTSNIQMCNTLIDYTFNMKNRFQLLTFNIKIFPAVEIQHQFGSGCEQFKLWALMSIKILWEILKREDRYIMRISGDIFKIHQEFKFKFHDNILMSNEVSQDIMLAITCPDMIVQFLAKNCTEFKFLDMCLAYIII